MATASGGPQRIEMRSVAAPVQRRLSHVLVALAALAAGARGARWSPREAAAQTAAPPPPSIDFAGLAERLKPVVVNITTSRTAEARGLEGLDRMFPFFFGKPGPGAPPPDRPRRTQHALGSGFIVDAAGFVVTNHHVVESADDVKVRLSDERELDAKVVGRDGRLDLALLQLSGAKDLPVATLGQSANLRVGEFVLAIGNPFGLGHTVTHGIVSATGRVIGAGPYDDFVQTDASINPGNSGGPLFNLRGEVVGINAIIEAEGRGIGFAIPVDALREVLPQLRTTGHVTRGRLGVAFQPVTPSLSRALGRSSTAGALVAEVEPGGPADRAGLRPGDLVVKVDGAAVVHAEELPRLVARHRPGERVPIEALRDGKARILTVTLGELRDEAPQPVGGGPAAPEAPGPATAGPLGVALADGPSGGAVVQRVRPRGAADGVLESGDVILEVDRAPVRRSDDVRARVRAAAGRTVLLRVRRGRTTRYVAVDLGTRSGR